MKKLAILAILIGSTLQAANFKVTWRAQGGNNNKLVAITALQDGIVLNDAKVNRGNCKSTFGLQKAVYLQANRVPTPQATRISLIYPKKPYPKTPKELADYLPKIFAGKSKMCYGTERALDKLDRDIQDLENTLETKNYEQGNEQIPAQIKQDLAQLKQDREKLFPAYEEFFCPTENKVSELIEQSLRESQATKFEAAVRESDISDWNEYVAAHPDQKENLKLLTYKWGDYAFYVGLKLCEADEDCKGRISDEYVEEVNAMDDNQLKEMDSILNEFAPKITLKQPENEWRNKAEIAGMIDYWKTGVGDEYYRVDMQEIYSIAQELDLNLERWIEDEKKFKEYTNQGIKFEEEPNNNLGRGNSHLYLYPYIALTKGSAEIAPKVKPSQVKQPTGIKLKYGQSFEFGVDVGCQILDVQLSSNKGVETFKF